MGIPLDICRGGLTPEQKVDWVEQRSTTHITLMAGDGFNVRPWQKQMLEFCRKRTIKSRFCRCNDTFRRPDLISSLCELSRKTRNIVIQNLVISISLTLLLVFSVISGKNDHLWLNVLA